MNSPSPPPSPATPTLAPCPFCGDIAHHMPAYDMWLVSHIDGCFFAEVEGRAYRGYHSHESSAIGVSEVDRWNRRAPELASLQSRLAEVERDAARYQVRRREFAYTLGEPPELYDEETDAIQRVQQRAYAALPAAFVDGDKGEGK